MTLDKDTPEASTIVFHYVESEDGEYRMIMAVKMLFEKTLEHWKIRQSSEVQLQSYKMGYEQRGE
jgi:hypothetical protein